MRELLLAAERGDTEVVRQLLKDGADINMQNAQKQTPVLVATIKNRVETVRVLIGAGADLNIRDNQLANPLLYASAEGLLEIVKLLVAAGADTRITNRYGGVSVIPASERGHVEVVEELLAHSDVNVNHINNLGWTALLEAIILGDGRLRHQRIVQMLVDHGADVNLADKGGVRPLRHARERGFAEIERILLRAGAHE